MEAEDQQMIESNANNSGQEEEEEESTKLKKRPTAALILTCGVCSAPAPDHLHFGANTCYSCRAFFRRTAQRILVKNLKRCKTGINNCEISNKTKICIHCRYLKCIKIGMTPNLLQVYRKKEDNKQNENESDIDDEREQRREDREKQEKTEKYVIDNNRKGSESYPQHQEEAKSISQGPEHNFQSYGYSQQGKRLQNPVELSIIQGFPFSTYSGNQYPASTVTSQIYNKEHDQENKTKNKHAEGKEPAMIKTDPCIFNDVFYEISMTKDGAVLDPTANNESHSNLHESKCQESQTYITKAQSLTRPSVIRSLTNARKQDQRFLKLESDMLKMHGKILKQTGSIFNYHANILDQHRMREQENLSEPLNYIMARDYVEVQPKEFAKQEVKEKKEIRNSLRYNEHVNTVGETEDLTENTPWRVAMERYLNKSSAGNLDSLVENVLLDTLVDVEKEKEQNPESINCDSETVNDIQLIKDNGPSDPRTAAQVSVIQGPEMVFTVEELNFLNKNKIIQEGHLRSTCPVSLHQARVGQFLGTLSMEGMLKVYAEGRKAQNYYHYMTMASQPFFSELTTRTQNLLMRHNTQLCFALNISNYFFGHTAKTAIEQEDMTGLVTGLGDYIRSNAPVAVNMPLVPYDDYFAGPWGTDRELEAKHRELTKSIGESIRDLDFSAYLLLYGVTLYNINQEKMNEMEIQQKDVEIIKKAQNYLDLLYKRYTKHLVGWEKASETRLNQRYLLDQMNECVLIFSMINCHLNDLTDCNTLDVSTVKLH